MNASRVRRAAWISALRAIGIGVAIVLVGTLPRNVLFAMNLSYVPQVPWSVPVVALYLGFFWRYLDGACPPARTAAARHAALRARAVGARGWMWALLAGGLGIIALVFGLRVASRVITFPQQHLPDLAEVPRFTVLALLIASAPIAAIVEESAFRGYMQSALERCYGLPVAILVSGTMFALVHLDFTPVLWPYYVAVAALYGTVTSLTRSILPAVVLHTAGNLYSNLDLWLHGRAEWQAQHDASLTTGSDSNVWLTSGAFAVSLMAAAWAFGALRQWSRDGGLTSAAH
jgi:uncharacterized protein